MAVTSDDMAGPFYQFDVPASMAAETAVVCSEPVVGGIGSAT
eukprot:SAG31_NODE_29614_length_392_cov_1.058020_1_plen_41_part_01